MKTCGIYTIRNTVSGRVYVGSSVHIRRRWDTHRHNLRAGKHHAPFLQLSWNKHGEAAFSFEIVDIVEHKADLVSREQYWIDALSAYGRRGYNAHPKAGSPGAMIGRKLSPEHLAKIRAILTLRNKSPEMRAITALKNKSEKMRKASSLRDRSADEREAARVRILETAPWNAPRSPEHLAGSSARIIAWNQSAEARARTAERNKTETQRASARKNALRKNAKDGRFVSQAAAK